MKYEFNPRKTIGKVLSLMVCAFLALGVMVAPAQAAPLAATKSNEFTVMTYNVLGEVAKYNEDKKSYNEKASTRSMQQVNMIKTYAPDILGTSEETDTFNWNFSSYLHGYAPVGNPLFSPASYFHTLFSNTSMRDRNSIWYKMDKFDLVATKTIWLHDGNVNQQGKIDGETNVRGATLAILRVKTTGHQMVVANTHLGLTWSIAKRQAEILVRETQSYAKQYNTKAIMYLGDFNGSSVAYEPLWNLKVVWDQGITSHTPGSEPIWVDHIYVNDQMTFTDRLVLTNDEWSDANNASDHKAVMAKVKFGSGTDTETETTVDEKIAFSFKRNGLQLTVSTTSGSVVSTFNYLVFYDKNGKKLSYTQLAAQKNAAGQWRINNKTIYMPESAVRADFEISDSQAGRYETIENVWSLNQSTDTSKKEETKTEETKKEETKEESKEDTSKKDETEESSIEFNIRKNQYSYGTQLQISTTKGSVTEVYNWLKFYDTNGKNVGNVQLRGTKNAEGEWRIDNRVAWVPKGAVKADFEFTDSSDGRQGTVKDVWTA